MTIEKNNINSIKLCKEMILKGEVVVIPCDTIYGLSSLYKTGFKKLQQLKGRDANKPFLVLATLEQAKAICKNIPDEILKIWPASLTVILETVDGEKLGIRVPDDSWLQQLLEEIGQPIYSTSVNISGEPPLLNFTDICKNFENKLSLCVKGNELQGTVPSTLIDAISFPYRILRQGSYVFDDKYKKLVIST